MFARTIFFEPERDKLIVRQKKNFLIERRLAQIKSGSDVWKGFSWSDETEHNKNL